MLCTVYASPGCGRPSLTHYHTIKSDSTTVSTAFADCCRSVTGPQCEPALRTDIKQTETRPRGLCGHFEGREMACSLQNKYCLLSPVHLWFVPFAQPHIKLIHNHYGFLTATLLTEPGEDSWVYTDVRLFKERLVNYINYHANSFFCNVNYIYVV